MKKIWVATFIIMSMAVMASISTADPVLFDGEGYISPTLYSQEQILQNVLRSNRAAGDVVTVSVDSANFPDIVLTTTIVDQNGQPITGLTQDWITVTEQSNLEGAPVAQPLTCFSEASGSGGTVTVALVFDLSGSMNHDGRLAEAKAAANYFFTNFSPADRGALVTFSSGGTEKIEISSRPINQEIKNKIDSLTAEGFTAVYDGTAMGIESIRNDPAPKAVVVFSDGQTNSDRSNTINSVIAEALAEGIRIYTIGLGVDLENMSILANSTGGDYHFSPTAQDMSAIYDEIARSIKNKYTICYTSHNPALDGTTRNVVVNYDGAPGVGTYQVPAALSANFAWQPLIPAPNTAVQFTDQSVTPGQQVVAYNWNFGDYGASAEASPTVVFPVEGTYPATLTITTDSGETATIQKNVVVSNVPTANFSWKPSIPAPGANVEFTNLSAPAGNIASYYWDFGAGGTSATMNPIASFPGQGAYPVTLTITDVNGLTATSTQTVIVSNMPQAGFTWTPEPQASGSSVSFTDASTPGAAPIVSWNWTFGNEGSSLERNPNFSFSREGSHPVTLIVQDQNGLTGTVTRNVTIQGCLDDCEGNGGCFIDSARKSRGNMSGILLGIFGAVLAALGFRSSSRKALKKWFLPGLMAMAIIGWSGIQSVHAGVAAGKFTLSPMIGMYVFDDDQNIDKDLVVGLGFGYNFTENIGAELMLNYGKYTYHYQKANCQCGEDDLTGFFPHLDLLYHFRPAGRLVPYLGLGIGASILDFDNFDKETSAAANLGGGLKLFITDNIALRADVRGIHVFDDSHNNLVATAGLVFQFPTGTRKPKEKVERPKPIVEPPKVADTTPKPTPTTKPPVSQDQQPTKVVPVPDKPKEEPPPVAVVTPKKDEPKPKTDVPPPVDTGVSIDLKILFDFDKAVIKPVYHNNIKYVADIMKKYPDIAIEIEGHTCSIGSEKYNLGLSRRRAEAVKRYLNEKFGVDNNRMSAKAYGESRPAFDNKTKEGRLNNRRVIVIKIVR